MPIPVTAHFLPELLGRCALRGSTAVIIDLLRASTTITRALDAGASAVVPCLEPGDALRLRGAGMHDPCILGGERGGVLIPGFDLGNSPAEYTPESVGGRTLLFTTTNGTRAVVRALGDAGAGERGADRILIGCLNNRAALCGVLGADARPVRLICAGTGGEVSLDDCLCAGAIVDGLITTSRDRFCIDGDDQAQLALAAYRAAAGADPDNTSLLAALCSSTGGRNLASIGLDADIADAARLDTTSMVPEFDCASGRFVPAAGPESRMCQ